MIDFHCSFHLLSSAKHFLYFSSLWLHLVYFLCNKVSMWNRATVYTDRNIKWFLHIHFENCNFIYCSSILFTESHWILICWIDLTLGNRCWIKSITPFWWNSLYLLPLCLFKFVFHSVYIHFICLIQNNFFMCFTLENVTW